MLHARGELLRFSDADLSSPIEEADKLLPRLQAAISPSACAGCVAICRLSDSRSIGRFSCIFNLMLRVTLGLRFKDT